ncbi:MAG: hypothetical protein WCI46_09110 [Verrucomicrobiota bacterium]
MTNEEAAFLLQSHRPSSPPDRPTLKALDLAQSHPSLALSLQAQLAFDSQISTAILSILPPDSLVAQIHSHTTSTTPLRPHLFTPTILAAAAGGLLFLATAAFFIHDSLTAFPGRNAVLQILDSIADQSTSNAEPPPTSQNQLADWFHLHGYEDYQPSPQFLLTSLSHPRILTQNGHPIALTSILPIHATLSQFHASHFSIQLPQKDAWLFLPTTHGSAALLQSADLCLLITSPQDQDSLQHFLNSLSNPSPQP